MKSNDEDKILFGVKDNNIFIKAEGHITANQCFSLRECLYKQIPNMCHLICIYIDLSNASYMDSTFLGLLIGIEKKLYNSVQKHLHIINSCDTAMEYLENLKLNNFLTFTEKVIPDDIAFKEFDGDIKIDELEKLKVIFNSHKQLCEISKENKEKFKTLQDMLKEQIKDKENS